MTRKESAQRLLTECFLGDYRFDVDGLLSRTDKQSEYFDSFLVTRIVDNARHPSALLRAPFLTDRVLAVLGRQRPTDKNRYRARRRAMVQANLTGNYADAPIRQWVR
jgi:hypothetical protein